MAEFPAMPLWTDAYMGDTTHLTTIEHGAYLLLLIALWRSKEKKLPADDKLLARYAKTTPGQWARMKPVIMAFFKVDGGSITQGRLTDEANAVKQRRKSQSDKAKARWRKTNENDDAGAMPDASRTDASLNPTPKPLTPISPSDENEQTASTTPVREQPFDPPDRTAEQDRFAEFWRAYPRQEGQVQAEAAFIAAAIRTDAEAIIAGAKALALARQGEDPRYTPLPAKWLKDKRWTDVHQPRAPQPKQPPSSVEKYRAIGRRYAS